MCRDYEMDGQIVKEACGLQAMKIDKASQFMLRTCCIKVNKFNQPPKLNLTQKELNLAHSETNDSFT